jgi:hypothetical protein
LLTFQILFSTWFFRRPASEGAGQLGRAAEEEEGAEQRGRAAEGAEQRGRAAEEEEGAGQRRRAEEGAEQMTSRLANLLLRQFSVRTDFRDLNISVPQSM